MIQLVYVSVAAQPAGKEWLTELLDQSRRNNLAHGITGMLLYKDGRFMQLLEGRREAVRQLYDKICRDPRHLGMVPLLEEPLAVRQFPGWTMSFRDLGDPEVRALPGYSPFMHRALSAGEFVDDPSGCLLLLHLFSSTP